MKRELVNRPVCDLPAPKDIWGTTNDQSSIQFCCNALWDQIIFIEMLLFTLCSKRLPILDGIQNLKYNN